MDIPDSNPPTPGTIDLPSVPFPPDPAVTDLEARLKFVDDLSLAESVRLDTQLVPDTSGLVGPRTYHDRFGLFLPKEKCLLQRRLDDISESAVEHDMKLNFKKSKIIPFNFTRKYDFQPVFSLDGHQLEVVYETQLVGIILTSYYQWDARTRNIVIKGNSRLCFLRRLKVFGASLQTLLYIYKLFCRSVEYAAIKVFRKYKHFPYTNTVFSSPSQQCM